MDKYFLRYSCHKSLTPLIPFPEKKTFKIVKHEKYYSHEGNKLISSQFDKICSLECSPKSNKYISMVNTSKKIKTFTFTH